MSGGGTGCGRSPGTQTGRWPVRGGCASALGVLTEALTLDLVVALNTVKKHVTHVLGKLGAPNRTEAVARARQVGLIP